MHIWKMPSCVSRTCECMYLIMDNAGKVCLSHLIFLKLSANGFLLSESNPTTTVVLLTGPASVLDKCYFRATILN